MASDESAERPTRDDVLREAARPMAYFTHDSHARNDIKCRRLIRRLGFEGYGWWWALCEILAESDGHSIRIGGEDGELWADELGIDLAGLRTLADALVGAGLCEFDGDRLFAPGMQRRAEIIGAQVAFGKANGKRGGRPRKAV